MVTGNDCHDNNEHVFYIYFRILSLFPGGVFSINHDFRFNDTFVILLSQALLLKLKRNTVLLSVCLLSTSSSPICAVLYVSKLLLKSNVLNCL